MARIAKVVTDIALDRAFDYEIPAGLRGQVEVGCRVRVPFGRKEALGFVVELAEDSDVPGLRPLAGVVGEGPLVPAPLLRLARWISDYYIDPIERCLRSVLPEAVRREDFGPRVRLVARLVPGAPPPVKRLTGGQEGALLALGASGPIALADAKGRGVSPASLQSLARLGLVSIAPESEERDPFAGAEFARSEPLALNGEQRAALDRVVAEMGSPRPRPVLLQGVTGSGKTEIYLQAIAACLESGRGSIVLVPEIALTPQSVERFKSRFSAAGIGVAVLHSGLSAGERRDEWHRIRSGRARVVVGARSAVFAPVSPLGLVVVDEEHEPSYKQAEAPRYHARDVAIVRGHFEGAGVLLGSATPSLESLHNAARGKYLLARLTGRIDSRALPPVQVIDMRQEAARHRGPVALSDRLVRAIGERLDRREQAILFLNRRGHSSALVCVKCGFVVQCPDCSISLTYHRRPERMLCHLCGYSAPAPRACPDCGDPRIRYSGTGTEKVEEAVARIFPKARVVRMDSDTMTRRRSYEETFAAFRAGRIDIIVGTQMIAKGLDFPNVTLVGVISADTALHLPDFRASERVFQLLTQVAGRAGRGDAPGAVLVQSFTPHHAAVQFAKRHDVDGFADGEMEVRRQFGYPPFGRAILVGFRGEELRAVTAAAEALGAALRSRLRGGALLGGPCPAPIPKIQRQHRYQVFLRGPKMAPMAGAVREALGEFRGRRGVSVSVDVDPVFLL